MKQYQKCITSRELSSATSLYAEENTKDSARNLEIIISNNRRLFLYLIVKSTSSKDNKKKLSFMIQAGVRKYWYQKKYDQIRDP